MKEIPLPAIGFSRTGSAEALQNFVRQRRIDFEARWQPSTEPQNTRETPIIGTIAQFEQETATVPTATNGQTLLSEPLPRIANSPRHTGNPGVDYFPLFIHVNALNGALMAENAALMAEQAAVQGNIFTASL